MQVVANVRAESEEDVASKIHLHTDFPGLQVSPVSLLASREWLYLPPLKPNTALHYLVLWEH